MGQLDSQILQPPTAGAGGAAKDANSELSCAGAAADPPNIGTGGASPTDLAPKPPGAPVGPSEAPFFASKTSLKSSLICSTCLR
jgi:hypothetical protein